MQRKMDIKIYEFTRAQTADYGMTIFMYCNTVKKNVVRIVIILQDAPENDLSMG